MISQLATFDGVGQIPSAVIRAGAAEMQRAQSAIEAERLRKTLLSAAQRLSRAYFGPTLPPPGFIPPVEVAFPEAKPKPAGIPIWVFLGGGLLAFFAIISAMKRRR